MINNIANRRLQIMLPDDLLLMVLLTKPSSMVLSDYVKSLLYSGLELKN